MTSITIPNSVTSIGGEAFFGTGWEDNQPNGILYLDNCCLGYKGGKPTGSLSLKEGTRLIGSYAFDYCTGLTSVTIPNSVTSIGSEAFCECTGLTEVNISDLSAWCKIDFSYYRANPLFYAEKLNLNGTEIKDLVIPNDITEIKNYVFSDCTGLISVTIPNSVTSIGFSAFYYCTGLTSVTIPNSVTSIGDEAFCECSNLTSVSIGNSVTSIGNEAFNYCWNLDTIISLNPTPPACSRSESFDYDLYSSATLYVPKDSYAKYFIDEVWGQFNNIKKIEILASSITLNNSTIELDKGNAATITATIAPSNATIKNIVWTSSNPQIATVDQLGKVTALSAGTATITAMANDGSNVSASCVVTVGVGVVEGVEMDNNAIEVARYDIHGRLLNEPTPGINIVKYSDGTTRKEIVKN